MAEDCVPDRAGSRNLACRGSNPDIVHETYPDVKAGGGEIIARLEIPSPGNKLPVEDARCTNANARGCWKVARTWSKSTSAGAISR
jgi:hypothetical protein